MNTLSYKLFVALVFSFLLTLVAPSVALSQTQNQAEAQNLTLDQSQLQSQVPSPEVSQDQQGGGEIQQPTAIPSQAVGAEQADQLAREGKFAEALQAYELLVAQGEVSAALYYNLGYCYFKQGMLGKSILNFERALRLNPADVDTQENLKMAYSLTDKMDVVEPIAIERWWDSFKNSLSSDGWAWLFVLLFALTITGVALFFFHTSVSMRKTGFFSAIFLFVLALFALSFSMQKRSEVLDSEEGIIMASSVTLSTSPDKNGSQMAVLHEGTHVTVIDQLGDWIEVKLVDGNVGWLKVSDVEMI